MEAIREATINSGILGLISIKFDQALSNEIVPQEKGLGTKGGYIFLILYVSTTHVRRRDSKNVRFSIIFYFARYLFVFETNEPRKRSSFSLRQSTFLCLDAACSGSSLHDCSAMKCHHNWKSVQWL